MLYYDPMYLTEKQRAAGLHIGCISRMSFHYQNLFLGLTPVATQMGLGLVSRIRAWMLSMGIHSSNLKYLFQTFHEYELRKQARRMGMAGPLGEIFDHVGVHSVFDLLFLVCLTLIL